MNQSNGLYRGPVVVLLLIAAALLLSACGPQIGASNWAGLSTDGRAVYLASGPSVLAYDVESNEALWTYPAEANRLLSFFAAPSVQGDRVVIGDFGSAGGLFSPRVRISVYGLQNGSDAPPGGWVNSEIARDKIVAPPLQVDDLVYVGTADNFIHALNVNDGSPVWSFETGHAIWGQPSHHEGVLYVTSMDWSAYALDAKTGSQIWRTPLNGALPSKPILGDNLVYVSSYDGAVHALDMATGGEVWQARAAEWVWAAPSLADGRVFYVDIEGNLYAVDAQTGEPLWNRSSGYAVQASPVAQGDSIYVVAQTSGEEPTGVLTAYSVADGEQQWQTTTPAPLFTNPVVVGDDTLVVALNQEDALLVGYNLETGGEQWRYVPPRD